MDHGGLFRERCSRASPLLRVGIAPVGAPLGANGPRRFVRERCSRASPLLRKEGREASRCDRGCDPRTVLFRLAWCITGREARILWRSMAEICGAADFRRPVVLIW